MTDLRVSNIERFAIKDGPGIRTVVFLQGCPLHCPWCANPETRFLSCENMKVMAVDELLSLIMRDEDYYRNSGGGLTISGGEPLLQYKALSELLRKAKELGLHTAVETSGQAPETAVRSCLPYVDLWLFDVKHTDNDVLVNFTGADGTVIFKNLEVVTSNDPTKVVLRLPIIPGFNLSAEHFEKVFSMAEKSGVSRLDVLPYHTLGVAKYEKLGIEYKYAGYSSLEPDALYPYVRNGHDRSLDINLL